MFRYQVLHPTGSGCRLLTPGCGVGRRQHPPGSRLCVLECRVGAVVRSPLTCLPDSVVVVYVEVPVVLPCPRFFWEGGIEGLPEGKTVLGVVKVKLRYSM